MADIFISQAYGDEEAGDQCAEALRRLGYSVARPADMPGHGHGGRWLAGELDRASCVLVLWSPRSVACAQVIADAERALIDRKYIPLVIGPLSLARHPRGLPLTGAPDLTGWAGAPDDPAWRKVLRAVRARTQRRTVL